MKGRSLQVKRLQFVPLYFDATRIFRLVQRRAHGETLSRGRRGDEADHRLVRGEGAPAPVEGNERKEPVLELVPFAGARRVVADVNGELVAGAAPGAADADRPRPDGPRIAGVPSPDGVWRAWSDIIRAWPTTSHHRQMTARSMRSCARDDSGHRPRARAEMVGWVPPQQVDWRGAGAVRCAQPTVRRSRSEWNVGTLASKPAD